MAPALAIADTAPAASSATLGGMVQARRQTTNISAPAASWASGNASRWAMHTSDPLDAIATVATVDRDCPLFREGDHADNVFEVMSGTIRVFKLLPDGRRQIIGFLEAGDFLGLSFNDTYLYTAEAVTTAAVRRFPRRRLEALIDENPVVRRRLLAVTANELLTAQEQMVLLGRKSAKEKLCTFLMTLSRKAAKRGLSDTRLSMPMGRSDIADYLGLTIETVSRTITCLKTAGLIRLLEGHKIELTDPDAIADLSDAA
ncbi:helix-turn-helix domain-containing protein [Skermanella rosea]|uniref:cyclic nucleotide-binding domain-containing protein n=1 Tax=Skermanella rosea TaxID=1817965 RepID=UPI00193261A5|nr:cyclic nucleotide-binding domain-containing protein [Skermanella rosea]UEM01957.1 helix-turn-helix domain-containing protein [Skermanella rosea]